MKADTASLHSRAPAGPLAQVISLNELHGEPAHQPPDTPVLGETSPLHSVRVRLQVSVGHAEMTVGELLAAKEQQVLLLDSMIDQPVELLLEGRTVARGQLVAVDGCFAVRISEVTASLSP